MPKVFISYSHDSTEHKQWVLQVSEQLRADGLECQIDQYVNGSPSEGWPLWMEKKIEQSDYVMLVCSPLYLKRYRREDDEGGRGVAFEGLIITQTHYDSYCHNKKFIPIIPTIGSIDHIPMPLKSFSSYHLPRDYDLLYRLLTNQPAVMPGSIGTIKLMPPESVLQVTHTTEIQPNVTLPQPTTQLQTPTPNYDPRNAAFLVPFRAKKKFMVGREQALEKVRQQLLEGKPTSIGQTALFKGIGGLGKTQLAVEYADHYQNEYPNGIYWITADENIDAQLTQIAVDARWVSPESEHSIKLDIARNRLKTYSDCLIVFDNLESIVAIQSYLPSASSNPHILVTSRSEQPNFTDVKLDLLDEEQSYLMLIQEAERTPTNEEDETAAREIVAALSGLPLALELAGAYLARRPISWCAYRDLLKEDLKQALPSQLSSLTKHEADLFKTLKVSEREISEEPLLAEVLDLLTWSGSSPMSLRLMAHLLNVKQTDLLGSIGLGKALRLLQEVPNNDRYAIHRLVQEVRRQDRPIALSIAWANTIAERLGDWFEDIRKEFRELPAFELELEHLRAWRNHAKLFLPITSIRLLWLQAYPADHRGRYLDARLIVQNALTEHETRALPASLLKANLLSDLAICNSKLGEYPRVLGQCKQALEIRRKLLGEKHPVVADSLNNLATCLRGLGNYPQALEVSKQAYEIRLEIFGYEHPDIALSLDTIASINSDIGKHQRALEIGNQALEMRRKLLGEKHPRIAITLSNISRFYSALGNHKLALEIGNSALEMRRELLGEKHPAIANSIQNLAIFHSKMGDYPRAIELGRHGLKIRRELLGESHPYTISSLQFVAIRLYGNPLTAGSGKNLVEEYLRHIPQDHPSRTQVLSFLQSRKGFRAPGKIGHNNKQKKKH